MPGCCRSPAALRLAVPGLLAPALTSGSWVLPSWNVQLASHVTGSPVPLALRPRCGLDTREPEGEAVSVLRER